MTYEEAKRRCHVRSGIYRKKRPFRVFWKNHAIPLDVRVPDEWKGAKDWEEYDPREGGQAYEAMA